MSVPSPRLSQLQQAITTYRLSLLEIDDAMLSKLQAVYLPSRDRLLAEIAQLVDEIGGLDDVEPSDLRKVARAQALLDMVETEVTRLAGVADRLIPVAQQAFARQAVVQGRALVALQAPTPAQGAVMASRWRAVATFDDLIGTMGDGSSLTHWLRSVVQEAVATVREALRSATTALLRRVVELPLMRVLTAARSETFRAFRQAALRSYGDNREIVVGWQWVAQHDDRTCNSCLAKSGDVFPLSDLFFPGHRRCRCVPVPVTKDSIIRQRETGVEWFERQPEAWRRARFPVSLRAEYDAGRVDLVDLAQLYPDQGWGPWYGEATVAQARANARARRSGGDRLAAGG